MEKYFRNNSNYSSFALFLLAEKDETSKKEFLALNTLEEIQSFCGKDVWLQKTTEFDALNDSLITEYSQNLDKLGELLEGKEKDLCTIHF